MQPFKLTYAHDREQTLDLISRDARIIAGGTNLVDLMKMQVETPPALVDISALGLDDISPLPDGGWRVGARVRNSDLAYHPQIRQQYPVLSEALLSGASPQLRNMATLGGNLMQRTRCPYFYNTAAACNKRHPGTGCAARPGYNRTLAILGTSAHCIATHPSDMCVALAALEATIQVTGRNGDRTIAFNDFHLLPGDTPHLETTLAPDELILSVTLPQASGASHYLKVRDRASYEFALASAAVVMEQSAGRVSHIRIALGGVGTKPWRAVEAERVLAGQTLSRTTIEAAAAAALAGAKLHRDNAFKKELAIRTIIQAIETTIEQS